MAGTVNNNKDSPYLHCNISRGLNYVGKCLNRECKAFGQPVIMHRGFDLRVLIPFNESVNGSVVCPGCKAKFESDEFTLFICAMRS